MKKIIIITASESYRAAIDDAETEGITTHRIAKTLGHRHFKWYIVNEMLELVLRDAPTTLRGFQEL